MNLTNRGKMWKKIKDWFKPEDPKIGFIEARRDGVSCPLYQDVNLTEPLIAPQEEIYIDLDNEPDEFVVTMTDGQVFTLVKDWVIKNVR